MNWILKIKKTSEHLGTKMTNKAMILSIDKLYLPEEIREYFQSRSYLKKMRERIRSKIYYLGK